MNLSEFKAWFEGFTEAMDGPPGERAWARIRERVSAIKDAPATERHHFHNYYSRPWPYYPLPVNGPVPYYGDVTCRSAILATQTVNLSSANLQPAPVAATSTLTDGLGDAKYGPQRMSFQNLGRVEAAEVLGRVVT